MNIRICNRLWCRSTLLCLLLVCGTGVTYAELDLAEIPADRDVKFSRDIAPVLKKNCLACHNDQDAEGGVNLETVQKMRESDVADVLVPGKPDSSRLFLLAAHRDDPVMPPEDNDVSASTLNPVELALLRHWIESGAEVDAMDASAREIAFQPLPRSLKTNYSSAMTPDARLAAVGFGNRIRLFGTKDASTIAEFKTVVDGEEKPAHQDFVQDLVIGSEGRRVISSGYRNVRVWELDSPKPVTIPRIDPNHAIALAMSRSGAHVAQLANSGELSVTEVGQSRWDWMRGFDLPSSWIGDQATDLKMAVEEKGEAVAVGFGDEVVVVRIDGKQPEMISLPGELTQISWAPEGRLVIGGVRGNVWVAIPGEEGWNPKEHPALGESVAHLGIGAANPNSVVVVDQAGHVARLNLDDSRVEQFGKLPTPIRSAAVFSGGDGLWAVNPSGAFGLYRFADKKWVELAKSDPVTQKRYQADRWNALVGEQLVAADKKDLTQAEANVKAEQGSLEAIAKDIDAKTKARDEKQKADAAAKVAYQSASKKAADAKAAEEKAKLRRTELSGSIKKLDNSIAELERKLAELKTQKADQEKLLAAVPDAKKLAETVKSTSEASVKAQKDADAKQAELKAAEDAVKAAADTKKRGEQRLAELTTDVDRQKQVVEDSETRQAALKKDESTSKSLADQSKVADRDLIVLAGGDGLLTYSEASSAWSVWSSKGDWLAEVPGLKQTDDVLASGESGLLTKASDGTVTSFRIDPARWTLTRSIGSAVGESPFADRVLCLDIDPSGRFLATGGGEPSRSGELMIWDLSNGQLLHRIDQPHGDTVLSLRFSPDGKTLASGGADRMIKLWNTEDWSMIKTLEGHTHHITAIDWNVNRRQLASGSADATVKVWDVETGKTARTISGLKSEVTKLEYVGRDDRIAIACGDGYFRIYRADNGRREINVKLPGGYLYALGADQEGTRFVVGGATGQAVLVDKSGKQLAKFNDGE